MKHLIRLLSVIGGVLLLSGCQQLGPSEHAVKFRKLPPFLGGGVSDSVTPPGAMVVVMPWEKLLRFNTSVQDVSWGSDRTGAGAFQELVHTRARDGNEVALAVTIRYQISSDPAHLRRLIEEVAVDQESVRNLIAAIGRADIRTHMNELHTSDYLRVEKRIEKLSKVRDTMHARLESYGIEILRVSLDLFRFERLNKDDTVDTSYQEMLTEIQKLRENLERERARVDTVRAKKAQEYNEAEGQVNRVVAEAIGFKRQATLRGDSILEARKNEALGILALGKSDVEGLTEQVNALQGTGGQALVKLSIVQEMIKADPKFITIDQGSSGNVIGVTKLDANELLKQVGILEALQPSQREKTIDPGNAAPLDRQVGTAPVELKK